MFLIWSRESDDDYDGNERLLNAFTMTVTVLNPLH